MEISRLPDDRKWLHEAPRCKLLAKERRHQDRYSLAGQRGAPGELLILHLYAGPAFKIGCRHARFFEPVEPPIVGRVDQRQFQELGRRIDRTESLEQERARHRREGGRE